MKNYQCTINTETLLSHIICNTNLPKKMNEKINTIYISTRNTLIQSHTIQSILIFLISKNYTILTFFFLFFP